METTALVLAAGGHRHGEWSPARKAAISAALLVAAVAIAAVLLLVRAWMRRAGAARAPCPGCGTFLDPGEECPNCPSRASGSFKRPNDTSRRRPAGTSGSAGAGPKGPGVPGSRAGETK